MNIQLSVRVECSFFPFGFIMLIVYMPLNYASNALEKDHLK